MLFSASRSLFGVLAAQSVVPCLVRMDLQGYFHVDAFLQTLQIPCFTRLLLSSHVGISHRVVVAGTQDIPPDLRRVAYDRREP